MTVFHFLVVGTVTVRERQITSDHDRKRPDSADRQEVTENSTQNRKMNVSPSDDVDGQSVQRSLRQLLPAP
jgi:hypothetical protein